jgi:hypothetical protein
LSGVGQRRVERLVKRFGIRAEHSCMKPGFTDIHHEAGNQSTQQNPLRIDLRHQFSPGEIC